MIVSSWIRNIIISLSLYQFLCFVYASRECSCETAQARSLTRASTSRPFNEYDNLLRWLISYHCEPKYIVHVVHMSLKIQIEVRSFGGHVSVQCARTHVHNYFYTRNVGSKIKCQVKIKGSRSLRLSRMHALTMDLCVCYHHQNLFSSHIYHIVLIVWKWCKWIDLTI